MGHGKAPNGECGMLYAAKYSYNRTDKAQEFEKHFREFGGATKCKVLK
jgi:hypothetical protein